MQNHNLRSLDILPPKVEAEDLYSSRLRVHVQQGDSMAPTLNAGDMAMLAPVHAYQGEGLYVIERDGAVGLYRVDAYGDEPGALRLMLDNSRIRDVQQISRQRFDEFVVGKVVALVSVLDAEAFKGAKRFA